METYYRVLLGAEYAKKKGKYGIVDTENIEMSDLLETLEDGVEIYKGMLDGIKFNFEGGVGKQLADYQMPYQPIRLISTKMQRLIQDYVDESQIQFVETCVLKGSESHEYYIMHFKIKIDVLDRSKMRDNLINPIIDRNKMPKNVNVFCYEEFDPSSFCISEKVKDLLIKNKVTGCYFQKITFDNRS
ncbi:imm11 family protein [Mangrovimonas sp. TPBH4]|uniref:imm11 family protein n=1 Tax=Mangrovimonas sp. TPBH4 TaxID=1645914 RepID=UPI0006B4A791|nr:DUF1629 domain-containing protein [Mangrovimonas sp. TPBH4]